MSAIHPLYHILKDMYVLYVFTGGKGELRGGICICAQINGITYEGQALTYKEREFRGGGLDSCFSS